MFPVDLLEKTAALLYAARARGVTIATAESCTGGLLSGLLTEIPGSSDVFTHGYVCYANAAKTAMLGVDDALIAEYGAVSAQTACAMAEGARHRSGADMAIATTGIAGPGGGSAAKPVGTVHLALAHRAGTTHRACRFSGDRAAIRLATLQAALMMLDAALLPDATS